jgi:hypothetical protein
VRAVAALGSGAVAVVVLVPAAAMFFPALGLSTGAAPAFVVALLAVTLLPAFELVFPPEEERRPLAALAVPLVAVALAVACTFVGLSVDRFDAAHPSPSQLVYALDADTGTAWWGSTETQPATYTADYLDGSDGPAGFYPYLSFRDFTWGAAEAADLRAPTVEVVNDRRVGDRREVTVRVTPQRAGVRFVGLELITDGGRVTGGRVEGRQLLEDALGGERARLTFHAPPADGVRAIFTVEGGTALSLRAIDGSDGLDGLPGYRPRPQDVAAAGSHSSDLVVVAGTTDLG